MSGWIKIEKDLETDPRVLRIAKTFSNVIQKDSCNAPAFPCVTLVVGALTRMWMYADSHIRNDNTLDMSAAELDEWLGFPGFCEMVPDDWLRVVDEHTLELPGYQEHNGVEAKKRALTQKRVQRHRASEKPSSVTACNASSLPDQTRPDQTKEKNSVPQSGTNGHPHESDSVTEVFEHWQKTHKHPKAKLDEKRRKVIRQALKHYSLEDLRLSIDGYKASPYHQGQNENKTVYDDIELILRDAKHIDAGIAFNKPATGGNGRGLPTFIAG